ncbi:unnamed protein product [Bursaphelenchus xylophilus]|uniref:(pine wood nematode) hypothetical protein n=1 Tax=Bursaphelenchus xylophilus TaxID=6326 RepID=A0A1I7RXJ2_BURXY|nr:unnamed protein product [Bursaphelenchus xylophilus]CAG9126477.1 unnamed protein product [Bursaphelenchus xylophilus]
MLEKLLDVYHEAHRRLGKHAKDGETKSHGIMTPRTSVAFPNLPPRESEVHSTRIRGLIHSMASWNYPAMKCRKTRFANQSPPKACFHMGQAAGRVFGGRNLGTME